VIGVPLAPRTLGALAERHGGTVRNGATGTVGRLVPTRRAGAGDLTVLLDRRYIGEAAAAVSRGAMLLVDEALAHLEDVKALPGWVHPHALSAMAAMLEAADAPADEPVVGTDCRIGPGAVLLPRVRIGARVTIGAGTVIGAPGFGWVTGPDGKPRAIPQLGGVVIEDDVHIGPLCTIAAGTIGPTILRRGVKLDAQVHVAHNCEIGDGTIVAAQSGFAGSVVIGKGVLIGGQVGIADHLTIGDGARIAAKSGVIGDVPAGATVAGYPAVERYRWLRGLAALYRLAGGDGKRTSSQALRDGAAMATDGRSPTGLASGHSK
jgi:UDP-3-O-[3-hydroxymyristoyl] glucosamine N-acyltransferase